MKIDFKANGGFTMNPEDGRDQLWVQTMINYLRKNSAPDVKALNKYFTFELEDDITINGESFLDLKNLKTKKDDFFQFIIEVEFTPYPIKSE